MNQIFIVDHIFGGHIIDLCAEIPNSWIIKSRLKIVFRHFYQTVLKINFNKSTIADGFASCSSGGWIVIYISNYNVGILRIVLYTFITSFAFTQHSKSEGARTLWAMWRSFYLMESLRQKQMISINQVKSLFFIAGNNGF